jgi:beta-glucosidase
MSSFFGIILCLLFLGNAAVQVMCTPGFPPDFLWGSATASYQVEGAYNVSGRGLSIWDVFSHTPGKTRNGDTGDTADDQYHRFFEDIRLMKSLGLKNYRMSLSWPRILPNGDGRVNMEAISHYNELFNTLIENEITPFVTLYHWDLPNALDNTVVKGWLDPAIVAHFELYAHTVFQLFGDRVKKWITFNEPLSFTNLGYGVGIHAPGRCSDRTICPQGNSATEPYIAAHNVLLAHAAAVAAYKTHFQPTQKGIIGITLNVDWAEPFTNSTEDRAAAQRHIEWQMAWYADPIFKGDYPQSMKDAVGSRLPVFTAEQKQLVKGSWDYFGMNHYTSNYVANNPTQKGQGWSEDQKVTTTAVRGGKLIGPQADSNWLYVVPWGIHRMLHWVADRYGNPPIYITENGVSVPGENEMPLSQALHDQFRIDFYSQYISNVSLAITEGVDVKGYFAWSLMDNFEWADGYSVRFGMTYVDYKDNLRRYPKDSAKWYSMLINS